MRRHAGLLLARGLGLTLVVLAGVGVGCAHPEAENGTVTVVSGVSLSRRTGGFLATNRGATVAMVTISTMVPRGTVGVWEPGAPRDVHDIGFSLEASLGPGESRWIDFGDLRSSSDSPLKSMSVVMLCSKARKRGGWPFEVITATPDRVTEHTLRVRKVFTGTPLP